MRQLRTPAWAAVTTILLFSYPIHHFRGREPARQEDLQVIHHRWPHLFQSAPGSPCCRPRAESARRCDSADMRSLVNTGYMAHLLRESLIADPSRLFCVSIHGSGGLRPDGRAPACSVNGPEPIR